MSFMRQPERPEGARLPPDTRPAERPSAEDLAARLLRLPAGHPSHEAGPPRDAREAVRARPGPAQSPELERENWWEAGPGSRSVRVDDWRGRPDRDGREASEAGEPDDPEPGEWTSEDTAERPGESDADGAPEDDASAGHGEHRRGLGLGWPGERSRRAVGVPPAGRDPYRPWFAGSSDHPWFAASPDGLLAGPGDQEAGATPGG